MDNRWWAAERKLGEKAERKSVVGRNNNPQRHHVLIPRSYKYVTLHGRETSQIQSNVRSWDKEIIVGYLGEPSVITREAGNREWGETMGGELRRRQLWAKKRGLPLEAKEAKNPTEAERAHSSANTLILALWVMSELWPPKYQCDCQAQWTLFQREIQMPTPLISEQHHNLVDQLTALPWWLHRALKDSIQIPSVTLRAGGFGSPTGNKLSDTVFLRIPLLLFILNSAP